MDPHSVFCPNLECPARGQVGKGNIGIHSRREQRYRCGACGRTFAVRAGTVLYRLRTGADTVTQVITLLAYGCPVAAIVQAFGLDERTVRAWWQGAGEHCRGVHEGLVEAQSQDLQQVQADEIRVRTQRGVYSLRVALALIVSTRLWLGGVVSAQRDWDLIAALAHKVRQMARCRPLLLAVDGLASYVTAFQQAFRSPLPRYGARGRSHLVAWPDVAIVQVVKQKVADHLQIERRIAQGEDRLISRLIEQTQGHGDINTAFIERLALRAAFRQRLSALVRRTRALARRPETLTAGMYVVGCLYNFCAFHHTQSASETLGRLPWPSLGASPARPGGRPDRSSLDHSRVAHLSGAPAALATPQASRRVVQDHASARAALVCLTTVACGATRLGAHLVFIDESGFLLIPAKRVKRTCSLRGQTPKLVYNLQHQKVSAITALVVSPKRRRMALYLHFRQRSFKGADVLRFLQSLVAQIAGPSVALWDGAPIHRNGAIRAFLVEHPRLHMEQLPGYAPEHNPAAFVWCQTDADPANSLLVDQDHLLARLDGKRRRLRRSQHLLWACIYASDLPWR